MLIFAIYRISGVIEVMGSLIRMADCPSTASSLWTCEVYVRDFIEMNYRLHRVCGRVMFAIVSNKWRVIDVMGSLIRLAVIYRLWTCDVDVRDCIEQVAGDRGNGESDSAGGLSTESSDLTAAADNPHTTGNGDYKSEFF